MTKAPEPRKRMPSPRLDEVEFKRRFLTQFSDPAFESLSPELERVAAVAWDAYYSSRKSPRTRKVGKGFADPDYDWIVTKQSKRKSATSPRGVKGTRSGKQTTPGADLKAPRE
jgi:hypothetical protein